MTRAQLHNIIHCATNRAEYYERHGQYLRAHRECDTAESLSDTAVMPKFTRVLIYDARAMAEQLEQSSAE
jgi:uncharacterized protein (UPF0147 family)